VQTALQICLHGFELRGACHEQNQHDAMHHGEGNAHGIKCQMLMYQNQAQQHCMMMESFTHNFLFLLHSRLTVTKAQNPSKY
jgi:hypothetical protein